MELIGKRDIHTKEAWIKGADINLRTLNDSLPKLNIDDWAIKIAQLTSRNDPDPNFEPTAFSIDQVSMRDSRFSLSDSRRDSIFNMTVWYEHLHCVFYIGTELIHKGEGGFASKV